MGLAALRAGSEYLGICFRQGEIKNHGLTHSMPTHSTYAPALAAGHPRPILPV